jgi:Holliday junction resolvasome RuvABC endonuclease subunit
LKAYVGIDPGILRLGLCSLDENAVAMGYETIKDDKQYRTAGRLDPRRLVSIVRRTQDWINGYDLYNLGADEIHFAIEEPTGRGSANSLKCYAVFATLAGRLQQRVDDGRATSLLVVPPMSLKKFVGASGHKARNKAAMREAVKQRWGFQHKSHDIVDAYALARFAMEA